LLGPRAIISCRSVIHQFTNSSSLYISLFSIPIRPHFFVRLEVTRDPPLILAITFLSAGPRFSQLAQQSAQSFSPPSFISLSSIVTDSRAHPSLPSSTSSRHYVTLVLLHAPSSCALCFAPKPYTVMHMHSAPPAWPSCPRVSGRLPRAACLARLYALVHCTGAHPCPSRLALEPLNLAAARLAVPPHLLSAPVPARILSACRGDLSPCVPTFGRI
jgi:hypothetical protein